jgi:uncharacterized protein (TIGR03067 family)
VWLYASIPLLAGQAPTPVKAAPPTGDFSDLVGEWRYVAMTVKGKKTDPKEVKKYWLVIAKDGAISIYDGKAQVVAGRITRVDAGKRPRRIDCVLAGRSEFDGRFAPEYAQEGIFEVGKGRLKMCRSRDPKEEKRPAEFASPAGKDLVLEEFERIK